MSHDWNLISTQTVNESLWGIILREKNDSSYISVSNPCFSMVVLWPSLIGHHRKKQENEERGKSDLQWGMNHASQQKAVDWGFCPNWVLGTKWVRGSTLSLQSVSSSVIMKIGAAERLQCVRPWPFIQVICSVPNLNCIHSFNHFQGWLLSTEPRISTSYRQEFTPKPSNENLKQIWYLSPSGKQMRWMC